MTESSNGRDFRWESDGPSECVACVVVCRSVILMSSSWFMESSLDEEATDCAGGTGDTDSDEMGRSFPVGESTSIAVGASRWRFPNTVADGPSSGDAELRSNVIREGASSTRVASVSFDESVPVRS